jgi:alkylation response protein AidB-like acyl-CoA dehydrogenase
MIQFRVPRRDMHFVLHDVLDSERHYGRLAGCEVVNRELVDAIIEAGAKFSENELFPLNATGDVEGCRFDDGVVTTPPGFRDAYRTYMAGGWAALSGDPAYGGQGLPYSLNTLAIEMRTEANQAWAMYADLSHGAMNALEAHGTLELKQRFLTRLYTGEWTGTMCLTEPHAGSDVGLLRTRAEPNGDGSYAITGTKIFISAGEHDLTENIVHLVLGRLPDAPRGTKGISLFVVPKLRVHDDGSIGARNGVTCGAIEHKMGIHGNATCVLNFDGATGYLVGAENEGMRCMFTMMNTARIAVGVQGLGAAEVGYQASLAYARERLQMRALSGPKNAEGPADPIIVHPDVRRMLLLQKALVEGGRALAYHTALQVDLAEYGATDEVRQAAQLEVDFLTPVVKGFLTERGFDCVSNALQIFGGHGYIQETGIEQYLRDIRIALIYEGTTQIQALDLMGRKTLMNEGRALRHFVSRLDELAGDCEPRLADMTTALRRIGAEWRELADAVGRQALADPEEVGAASTDFLMFSGYALLALFWARMALVADVQLRAGANDAYLRGKLATARFYMQRVLPQAEAHRRSLLAGGSSMMALDVDAFDHL